MEDFNYKLDNFLLPYVRSIKEPIILELGVQMVGLLKNF